MQYPIYRLNKKTKRLEVWDGPYLSKKEAKKLIKKRIKQWPKHKFFIVEMEA